MFQVVRFDGQFPCLCVDFESKLDFVSEFKKKFKDVIEVDDVVKMGLKFKKISTESKSTIKKYG